MDVNCRKMFASAVETSLKGLDVPSQAVNELVDTMYRTVEMGEMEGWGDLEMFRRIRWSARDWQEGQGLYIPWLEDDMAALV